MDFQTAVKTCFQKYVTFSGRARRKEYWFWFLFSFVSIIVVSIIDKNLFLGNAYGKNGPLYTIFLLGTFLPGLSVFIRRLHDLDKSGWWALILIIPVIGFIVGIVWASMKGTVGDNRFGPDTLAS